MKIAIDYRLAAKTNRGMSRVCKELTEILIKDSSYEIFLFVSKEYTYLPSIKHKNTRIISTNFKNYFFEEQIIIPFMCLKYQINILWSPYCTFPVLLNKRIKLYVTIHDLIFLNKLKTSSLFQEMGRIYRKYCLLIGKKRIDRCFTVSNFSKKEIFNRLKLDSIVIYNCYNPTFSPRKIQKDTKFYFTVSGDAYSKNLPFLIDIFKEKLVNETLVIAGVNKKSRLRNIKQNNIIFLDTITDDVLNTYYNKAEAFIFPSIMEGFGLPVIEALATNAKVLSSNRTSLPELVKDFGLLFDPYDESDFLRKFYMLQAFKINKKSLVDHLSQFSSWETNISIFKQCILNDEKELYK